MILMYDKKKSFRAKTRVFKESCSITQEEEVNLAKRIQTGKPLLNKRDEELSEAEIRLKKEAQESIEKLIKAYSPLIESVALEQYRNSGSYGFDEEDFIAEAYLISCQCAKTFDPSKGKKIIRFSSYAPRPITSALSRMSMRSRTQISVPTTVMANARKWSHTYFEMKNKGFDITDEQISEISGVDMDEHSVMEILGLSADSPIEDIFPPSIKDEYQNPFFENDRERLIHSIENSCSPDMSKIIISALGLKSGTANTFSKSRIYNDLYGEESISKLTQKIDLSSSYLHHPVIRYRMIQELNSKGKGKQ